MAVEAFKAKHYLGDEDLAAMQAIRMPSERQLEGYLSTCSDIRDWLRREKPGAAKDSSSIDWNDVVFEEGLLNPQYLGKKRAVFQKIAAFVEKFKGVGGRV